MSVPPADPQRVIADLRELAELTGGPDGARRVAWTDEWRRARSWLEGRLASLPVECDTDAAGNLWATLPGTDDASGFVAVGSHLDSVPNGGWLDGALGVVAGIDLLRRRAYGARPPVTLRLVDWNDEEGARFGRSLFGSTAARGALDVDALRAAHDGTTTLAEAARANGVDLIHANDAARELEGALAYLELHIEQGPVLSRNGRPVAVVDGCSGVERHVVRLTGEAAHAGAAPMSMRRDPVVAAARAISRVTAIAHAHGATATVGRIAARPGTVTVVAAEVELTIDLRHGDPAVLAGMLEMTQGVFADEAREARVAVAWEPQWRIDPVPFHRELIELGRAACEDAGATPFAMTSGALHDAASVAQQVPTVMLFVPSRRGISHSPSEDTDPADLAVGVRALDALLERTVTWAARRPALRSCGQAHPGTDAPFGP